MTHTRLLLLSSCFLCMLVACSEDSDPVNTTILASDFDQACILDEDCTPISDGDACECHVCPSAAIHKDAFSDYQSQWTAAQRAACAEKTCTTIGCGDPGIGYCKDSACTLRQPVDIQASDYDNSCSTDDDCMVIAEGEICQLCACPSAAVNVSAQAQIDAARGDIQCHNPDAQCTPCANLLARCSNGTCTTE